MASENQMSLWSCCLCLLCAQCVGGGGAWPGLGSTSGTPSVLAGGKTKAESFHLLGSRLYKTRQGNQKAPNLVLNFRCTGQASQQAMCCRREGMKKEVLIPSMGFLFVPQFPSEEKSTSV